MAVSSSQKTTTFFHSGLARSSLPVILVWLAASLFGQSEETFRSRIDLVAPENAGIEFVHTDGQTGQRYMVETIVGSLAIFDFDNDGLLDLYFVSGASLPGSPPGLAGGSRLYRNLGHWKFKDVTETSGLVDYGYGMGVVIGDYDNDGFQDLFLTHFGTNSFFINRGDGTFFESASKCLVEGPHRVGAGACFVDIDLDGDLDLYTSTYVHFAWSEHRVRTVNGKEFHTGPKDYRPANDFLYRNNGEGLFEDVSAEAGITSPAPGMAVVSADFDRDGDFDIMVANDQTENFLLLNDGTGKFAHNEIGAGVAFDRIGKANGNMGIDLCDIDGDLLTDILVTTYQNEMPVYYRCTQPGLFEDHTNIARLDSVLKPHVKWGIGAVDFDLDGDRDIFIACGHFFDNLPYLDDRTQQKVINFMLCNDGKGKLKNVTKIAGSALQVVESSRAAAFDDLDNDGDVDIVVQNVNAKPTLGRNETTPVSDRLSVRLVSKTGSRDSVGSEVFAISQTGKTQVSTILAGRGYESSYGTTQYFGSDHADPIREIVVRWPHGQMEQFTRTGTDMLLIEGSGKPQTVDIGLSK